MARQAVAWYSAGLGTRARAKASVTELLCREEQRADCLHSSSGLKLCGVEQTVEAVKAL